MGFVLIEVSDEALAAIEALLKGSFRRLSVECSRIRGEVLVFEERLSSGDYHLLHSILVQEMEW
ncbi:MAG: hypothetical protein GXO66_07535 [Euryarchaeota archaeon]|nr:hypothetical protein [Euryarchaeota archaeon]